MALVSQEVTEQVQNISSRALALVEGFKDFANEKCPDKCNDIATDILDELNDMDTQLKQIITLVEEM